MKLQIDPKIFSQHPNLKIGAILIKGINNSKRVSSVESLLRGVCAQRAKEFKDKDVFDDPMVSAWCQAYGKFGVNPKKYSPSIAALLKRIQGGKEIPHINVLVDLNNYFSLKYMLPVGGEDLDWLCGDVRLTFAKGGEAFRPIGSIEIERAGEGEASYIDEGGITCRYWNYRECERTKFSSKTVNAMILIEDLSNMHLDEFGKILKDMQNTIIKYIGGQIEPYILNEENTEIDLGIQGRPHADDAKVPQQEKAHYMEQHPEFKEKPEPAPVQKYILPNKEEPSFIINDSKMPGQMILGIVSQALTKAFPDLEFATDHIEYPAQDAHGDYASNVAMHLSKTLGLPPRDIAQKIIDNLEKGSLIDKVEIAGPGFINFFLSKPYLESELAKVLNEKENYGSLKIGDNKNVIVEYSAPNIAKPLGVHHLLSTIIGQSIYNFYKEIGFNAISINHIGDWGTQFGKLIFAYKKWGSREVIEQDPIAELLKLYVKFHDEAESDSSLEDEGRNEFKKFEEGDEENRDLWKWFVELSMDEINNTYNKLGGIHFDFVQGESFYEDKMDAILNDGKAKGVFVEGKEGAYVINYDDENIPTVPVQKKDGTTLYMTRDFATLKYRIDHWDPLKILYVVDVAQSLHFKQLFEGAKQLAWYNGVGEHILFGRMHMKDGTMSTRKGTVVLLNDVLDEAVKRATQIVEEKNPNLNDKENVARVIGIAAVKYNILSQNRTTDITFDWETMLSFDGNSAPYLQYSYARAKSIIRRISDSSTENIGDPENVDEKITDLLRILPKYSEYLIAAAKEYKPNILANYIYNLAQKFNSFYNTVPVLRADSEEKRSERIRIVEASAQVIKNGLRLLGVEVVEEM